MRNNKTINFNQSKREQKNEENIKIHYQVQAFWMDLLPHLCSCSNLNSDSKITAKNHKIITQNHEESLRQ